ncbi:cold-shock protein [Candidatus Fukatsuia symbiotica]|uniref:Cold-shock protein n=1 Tax=Candidatus Fukatsuia symbiotica TaxID=1878942 RepID=A0A2U8I3N8_9GAMM|nr:cold-shock protein [Candidatus Fukatsuia symbiotica]AWK13746.1 cold-shock protein [Candidatus Fukatsuia symbiotica]
MKGSVKWFDEKKGFGFITPGDGSHDALVCSADIVTDGFKILNEGQIVEYDVEEGAKGPVAKNVRST